MIKMKKALINYDKGYFVFWSGKRDSNSRPQPWQGYALPTELFPLYGVYYRGFCAAVNWLTYQVIN